MNFSLGHYPLTRLRRTRRTPWLRRMVAEHTFSVSDLIWPLFVVDHDEECTPIPSMPQVSRLSKKGLLDAAERAVNLGIPAIALFPCLQGEQRNVTASHAYDEQSLICRRVRLLKEHFPQLGIMCDVALDPFTSHGHDGLLDEKTGAILNDQTVDVLVQQALAQARAGCDILAPSDMMDGRVGRIRQALENEGFHDICIMSYAAKYASALYAPFRQALFADKLLKSDKKTYQMSPSQRFEPLREVALDIQEGADMVIVKPSLFYLDIVWRIKEAFGLPTLAYQVSGEYAMMASAFENGLLHKEATLIECMTSLKRAGADAVVTNFAPQMAELLEKGWD
jgi:porphobilinogen synthase